MLWRDSWLELYFLLWKDICMYKHNVTPFFIEQQDNQIQHIFSNLIVDTYVDISFEFDLTLLQAYYNYQTDWFLLTDLGSAYLFPKSRRLQNWIFLALVPETPSTIAQMSMSLC